MNKVLLLNAGGSEVLNVIPGQRAIGLLIKGRARPEETYTDCEITSEKHRKILGIDALPCVVILGDYKFVPYGKRLPIKKSTLMIRDENTCQYCSKILTSGQATIDHVIPTSRGGKHDWKNVVLSCKECNNKKGNKTPQEAKMPLKNVPYAPTRTILFRRFVSNPSYNKWIPYLDKDKG
jgi:5-methylcytosine-specific restriction endonuclease McrA